MTEDIVCLICRNCSLKTFAKSGGEDFPICCLTLLDVETYFDENQQESVCRKKPHMIGNTFHKFFREFLIEIEIPR